MTAIMNRWIWTAVGVAAVTGAFFIPSQTGSIWPSVLLSSGTAMVFLAVYLLGEWKSAAGSKKAIGVVLLLLMLFTVASAAIYYRGSLQQEQILMDIRETIFHGIAKTQIQEPMLTTLREYYYPQDERGEQNLQEIFTGKYGSKIGDDDLFQYGQDRDDPSPMIFVETLEPGRIVMVGQSPIAKGIQEEYQNYDGSAGLVQTRGVLTPEGVRYEVEN